ncbi:hypothetical protein GF376_04870 [Candidatus Peregrinibacteria bacterium]|nr:hypothetical protein [Candidatus Peregrinibacteria bacterium]
MKNINDKRLANNSHVLISEFAEENSANFLNELIILKERLEKSVTANIQQKDADNKGGIQEYLEIYIDRVKAIISSNSIKNLDNEKTQIILENVVIAFDELYEKFQKADLIVLFDSLILLFFNIKKYSNSELHEKLNELLINSPNDSLLDATDEDEMKFDEETLVVSDYNSRFSHLNDGVHSAVTKQRSVISANLEEDLAEERLTEDVCNYSSSVFPDIIDRIRKKSLIIGLAVAGGVVATGFYALSSKKTGVDIVTSGDEKPNDEKSSDKKFSESLSVESVTKKEKDPQVETIKKKYCTIDQNNNYYKFYLSKINIGNNRLFPKLFEEAVESTKVEYTKDEIVDKNHLIEMFLEELEVLANMDKFTAEYCKVHRRQFSIYQKKGEWDKISGQTKMLYRAINPSEDCKE